MQLVFFEIFGLLCNETTHTQQRAYILCANDPGRDHQFLFKNQHFQISCRAKNTKPLSCQRLLLQAFAARQRRSPLSRCLIDSGKQSHSLASIAWAILALTFRPIAITKMPKYRVVAIFEKKD